MITFWCWLPSFKQEKLCNLNYVTCIRSPTQFSAWRPLNFQNGPEKSAWIDNICFDSLWSHGCYITILKNSWVKFVTLWKGLLSFLCPANDLAHVNWVSSKHPFPPLHFLFLLLLSFDLQNNQPCVHHPGFKSRFSQMWGQDFLSSSCPLLTSH
jgi:hypothetical protein